MRTSIARSVAVPRRPRVYLVRHGEADWNAEGRLCTRTDRPLTDTGRQQAIVLGRRLAGVRFDAAITSPLVRASETASLILHGADRADPPPIEVDGRLVEVDFGPFEGWTEADLAADPRGRAWRAGTVGHVDGMEDDSHALARAREVFAGLERRTQTTLVVSHGYFLRLLIVSCVLGLGADAVRRLRIRNCRPAVVEPGRPPLLLGLNLEGAEVSDVAARAGEPRA